MLFTTTEDEYNPVDVTLSHSSGSGRRNCDGDILADVIVTEVATVHSGNPRLVGECVSKRLPKPNKRHYTDLSLVSDAPDECIRLVGLRTGSIDEFAIDDTVECEGEVNGEYVVSRIDPYPYLRSFEIQVEDGKRESGYPFMVELVEVEE